MQVPGSKPIVDEEEKINVVLRTLKSKGIDPSKVISCVPSAGLPGHVKGVRGCNLYDRCPFHRKDYGGFKWNWRPKNVGYYLKTNDGTPHQIENFLACHAFVQLFRSRINAAQQAENDGWKPGSNPGPELIRIVAQEGELIRVKVNVPVDERMGANKNAPYKWERRAIPVPEYQYPEMLQGDSYEAELERSMLSRLEAEERDMPAMPVDPDRVPMDADDEDEDKE